jgi:hypothetical protein
MQFNWSKYGFVDDLSNTFLTPMGEALFETKKQKIKLYPGFNPRTF